MKSIETKIETVWDFVSAYHPKYYSSNYIAEFLDLEMGVNIEESPEPTEEMKLYQAQMLNKIYEESIRGYIETLKGQDIHHKNLRL